jgi:hypothetical protein
MTMTEFSEKKVISDVAPLPNVDLVYNRGNKKVLYCVMDDKGEFNFLSQIETPECIFVPPPITQKLAQLNFMYLPEYPEEYDSDKKLAEDIHNYICKYTDYAIEYRKLDVWYTKLTWMYDRLPIVPYRRALGDTGRGKTRWMTVVGSICYRAYMQGAAASAAAIYRASEIIRGTMLVDENYFDMKTDTGQAIIAILNCGYSKATGVVMRCVGANYDPTPFMCYGPKLIASRGVFPDEATENRTLSHFACQTCREDIPVLLNDDFWNESVAIRNKLLFRRFKTKNINVEGDSRFLKLKIDPRLKEVLLPLEASIFDSEVKVSLRSLAEDLDHNLREVRSSSFEGIVLTAILCLAFEKQELIIKNIAEQIEELEPTIRGGSSSYLINPRKLGWFCRTRLGLKVERVYSKEKNTNPYTIIDDISRLMILGRQYGVDEKTITSITTITQESPDIFINNGINGGNSSIPTLLKVNEVIEVIDWIQQITKKGKEEVSTLMLYDILKRTVNGDFEKALAFQNWLTSQNIISINEKSFTCNMIAIIFFECRNQRSN